MTRFSLTLLLCLPGMAATVFSNGDPDLNAPSGGNFLDCMNCRGSNVRIYDNFTLTSTTTITGFFGSWELLSANSTNFPLSASWEIRTGLAQGNSGLLINGGTGSLATSLIPIPNGGGSGVTYFQGTLSGLSFTLGPGTYWLNISPYLTNFDETYLLGANGANGVNALIDGQSYVTGPYWSGMQNVGAYLQPFTGRSTYDFAYGVLSDPASTPEPGSLALFGAGAALLLVRKLRS